MRKAVLVVTLLTGLAPAAWSETGAPAPLTYSQVLDPQAVTQVQQRLKAMGSFNGETDGKWGADSAVALQQFQQTHGLQVTGQLNQATLMLLGLPPTELLNASAAPGPAAPGPVVQLAPATVRVVQQQLQRYGFYQGAIDGEWGPGTEAAMNQFQSRQGLPQTAILNAATVRAMGLDPRSFAATD